MSKLPSPRAAFIDPNTGMIQAEWYRYLAQFERDTDIQGDHGDITVASDTWTIDNDAITFAKLQNIATDTLIGRATAGTGDPESIALTAAGRALIDDANAAAQ